MGKSSLVEHTLQTSDRALISVDLRGLDSAEDFIDRVLLRLETALATHKPLAKHLPASFKEALSHSSEVKVNLRGFLEVSAKSKPKASTVVRVMDALERASRWRSLIIFFDEFQEIAAYPRRVTEEAQLLIMQHQPQTMRHRSSLHRLAALTSSALERILRSAWGTATPITLSASPAARRKSGITTRLRSPSAAKSARTALGVCPSHRPWPVPGKMDSPNSRDQRTGVGSKFCRVFDGVLESSPGLHALRLDNAHRGALGKEFEQSSGGVRRRGVCGDATFKVDVGLDLLREGAYNLDPGRRQ